MLYAYIGGTGAYLPQEVLTNAALEQRVDTSDEWIMKRVGIASRHIASKLETPAFMAEHAARQAIEAAQLDIEQIDLIIVATSTPDQNFPSTAVLLQQRLGHMDCAAFDLNAACSGFIYALTVATQFIENKSAKNVLVVGVDALSHLVNWNDRSTCVLFGDGAGAVVLKANNEPGILATKMHANGNYKDLLYAPNSVWTTYGEPYIQMEGNEVFKIAVTKLDEMASEILADFGIACSQIDWLIPHQANVRIIRATAKRLSLPMERVMLTIEKHGNTSAASIPLALNEGIVQHKITRGQTLLLEAFGAGFTWGAVLAKY